MNESLKQSSPELMKMSPGGKALGKRQQRMPPSIPDSVTNVFGIPGSVLSLLEVRPNECGTKDIYMGLSNERVF